MLDLTKLHELTKTWEEMSAIRHTMMENLSKPEHSFNRILVAMCK